MNIYSVALYLLLLIGATSCAKSVSVPDVAFMSCLLKNADKNKDGLLSNKEVKLVDSLDCSGYGIDSLSGLGLLENLRVLNCSANNLESLDLSENYFLQTVYCDSNKITFIDLTHLENIHYLSCSRNHIVSLRLSPSLDSIDCSKNLLSSLDVNKLTCATSLNLSDNIIHSLILDSCRRLRFLDISLNKLQTINFSMLDSLDFANTQSNPGLTSVILSSKQRKDRVVQMDGITGIEIAQ